MYPEINVYQSGHKCVQGRYLDVYLSDRRKCNRLFISVWILIMGGLAQFWQWLFFFLLPFSFSGIFWLQVISHWCWYISARAMYPPETVPKPGYHANRNQTFPTLFLFPRQGWGALYIFYSSWFIFPYPFAMLLVISLCSVFLCEMGSEIFLNKLCINK